ncbi:MAG: hypothetical protein ACRDYC_14240, partial [Acidimicrobiales bacterium]
MVAAGVIVAFSLAQVALGGVASAATPVLTVSTHGTDAGNCQAAACQTIGYAVSQAPAGAVVNVGPGTYAEQISINKPLTLQGRGAGSTVIAPTATPRIFSDTDSSYLQLPIVDVSGTIGVNLSGFTVNGAAAIASYGTTGQGCLQSPLGIYENNASGTISHVAVANIQLPSDLFGCQGGQGIYVNSSSG